MARNSKNQAAVVQASEILSEKFLKDAKTKVRISPLELRKKEGTFVWVLQLQAPGQRRKCA